MSELFFMFMGFFVIVIWFLTYKISCLSFLLTIVIWASLFKGIFGFLLIKKRCFAKCYLNPKSSLYKIFMKSFSIFIFSFFTAFILFIALLYYIASSNVLDIFILGIDIFFLYYFRKFLLYKVRFFSESVQSHIIGNTISSINAIILMIIFIIITLYQTPPQYLQETLYETIQTALRDVSISCEYFSYLISFFKVIEAVKWWLLIRVSLDVKELSYIKELIWFIFLIGNYLVFFAYGKFIFGFSNFLKGVKRYD